MPCPACVSAKTLPDRSEDLSCSAFKPSLADVTNSVSSLVPPKMQEVGRGTGRWLDRYSRPDGAKRSKTAAPQRAVHKQPSTSIAEPSGTPGWAASTNTRLLCTVPESTSKSYA